MTSSNTHFEYYFGDVDIIAIPDNVAVRDGVVTLTGGYDHQGRPIIVFPLDLNLRIQMAQVTEGDLVNALIYYWRTIRIPDKSAGLSFLIDFRAGSIIIIDTIISTINAFKHQYSMSVGSVYIIRPQDQDLSNRLKVQLGLKKLNFFSRLFSQKHTITCTAEFQCNLLKTSAELSKYIVDNLLTNEFGGSLRYDHKTWLFLKQNTDTYLNDIIRIKNNFPDAEERIRLLNEYENTESELVADEAIGWMRRRFDEIVSNSGLEDLFLASDELLLDLSPGTGSSKYDALRGNPHLDNYRMLTNAIRAKLVEIQNHFQSLLIEAEKKMNICQEFKEVKDISGETVKWIQRYGIPSLDEPPKIASNLNEAESIARDFHNQMFIPGMKSIAKCEDICQGIQKNALAQGTGDMVIDRSQYLHKLQSTITTFNNNLQSRRKLYSDVYQFHLILNRVISWLKRTIKTLPLELISYHENMAEKEPLPFGNVWKTRVHQYLLRHPAPKLHQIDLIEKLTPMMKDVNVRNEARLLSYRLRVIMKLMASYDVTVAEVREVFEWKRRLKADAQVASEIDKTDDGKITDESNVSLFMKIEPKQISLEGDNIGIVEVKNEIAKPSQYQKKPKANEQPRVRTSPHYNRNLPKANIMASELSRSQPRLNANTDNKNSHKRTKELIMLAEKTVRDSLEDTHLISERDLRINSKQRDEEELSMILNQLLYDINSQHDSNSRKTSRNPSSVFDADNFADIPSHYSTNSLHRRRNDYF